MKSGAWIAAGALLMLYGLPRGGEIGTRSFVFLALGVGLVIVGLREAPWPEAHRGPPPDEVDVAVREGDREDGVDSPPPPGGTP